MFLARGLSCTGGAGLALLLAVAGSSRADGFHPKARAKPLKLPLVFVENRGQWQQPARFVARGAGVTAWLEPDALVLQVEAASRGGTVHGVVVRLSFERCSEHVELSGEHPQAARHNFFLGNDRTRWRVGVTGYRSVVYRGLYPGIDLRVREGEGGILEYDLLVAPSANLDGFSVRCAGVEALHCEADGTLVLRTAAGDLCMARPRSWEEEPDGTRRPVEIRYRLLGRNGFGFATPERRRNRPLVVDPGLLYSTFLGGSAAEAALAMAVDSTGAITVGGLTGSTDFPTTPGAYDRTYNDNQARGKGDAFVARFSPSNGSLVYATCIGGSGLEWIASLGVDATGATVIAGVTWSWDFPTTPGSL